MDATKLRNSCICGNTVPYLECCGPFADSSEPKPRAEDPNPDALLHAFRHGLHELSMALFPLRALYQAYWERLSKEDYPHDLLMGDPDYGRSVMENFFWDYFVQYSDARPILRTARDVEGKDLRMSHDLMQWSYAPLWLYWVEERGESEAGLRNAGNGKLHKVRHAGRMPHAGAAVLTRVLPFRGREFCGHAALAFPPPADPARLDALFRAACRELKIKPGTNLRPDVHGEEWRRHGGLFLAMWRAETYDARVGRPSRPPAPGQPLTLPVPDREALASALGSGPADGRAGETRAAAAGPSSDRGASAWDLRHRALRLARLEAKGSALTVTLVDAAFRDFTLAWLRARLEGGPGREDAPAPLRAQEGDAPAPTLLDEWVHLPHEALNGQTPIQASVHDWGRRRLKTLLLDMTKHGRDVTGLKRQLGL